MSTTKQVKANWPRPRWRAAGGIERGPAVAGTGCAGGHRGHRASLPRDVRRAVSDRNERRRHPPTQQRAGHGYAPAPQASRESRQPRRVTSGLLLRPVPRPRRRASGLAIGGSHVGSPGARKRSGLAPGRGRRGTAAGSHGPGAVAARDPWPTNDHRRTEQGNSSSVNPFCASACRCPRRAYPPGHAPDQAALVQHAQYHGYLVVRYRLVAAINGRDDRWHRPSGRARRLSTSCRAPASESSSNRATSRGASCCR